MKRRVAHLIRAGFTMVEVMMGLAILAVGAAAVIALLKFTVLGTLDSRHIANASIVGASYIERIQTAALMWNNFDNSDLAEMDGSLLPASENPAPNFGSLVAGFAGTVNAGDPSAWAHFGASDANAAALNGAMATINGDSTGDPTQAAYCSHVRITWVSGPDLPPGGTAGGDSFRVEVRTFWARSGRTVGDECALAPSTMDAMFANPTATLTVNGVVRSRAEYGVINLTTLVRRNT